MKHAASSNLWFGTDESYWAFDAARTQVAALQTQGQDALKTAIRMAGGGMGDDPFGLPSLVNIVDGVAQIDISGSLINGSAGFGRLFGVLGYSDIAGALQEVATNSDVKSIMLMIDSGGGAVNGLEDVGNMIQAIGQIKPVTAFTDGSMFSAAYWLGASANQVVSTRTAQSGSVGTLIIHMDMSKALEMSGRKPTLVRFGKFKALANPMEPLSEDGKAELQSLADAAGKIFVDYVSARRGTTPEKFQATAGEGRVFMGQDALAVGLIDKVASYGDTMSMMKKLDTSKPPAQNPRAKGNSSMKAHLSHKTLLAIATGVALDALGLSAVEANAEGVQLDATGLAALTAEATELITARDAALAKAKDAGKTEALATAGAELTTLKAEVVTLTGKVTLLEAGASELTGKVTAANELSASYAGIVKTSLSVMSVALGGAADVGATLVGKELLAEHDKVAEQFKKKFPTGGVAAVNPEMTQAAKNEAPPAAFLALLGKAA